MSKKKIELADHPLNEKRSKIVVTPQYEILTQTQWAKNIRGEIYPNEFYNAKHAYVRQNIQKAKRAYNDVFNNWLSGWIQMHAIKAKIGKPERCGDGIRMTFNKEELKVALMSGKIPHPPKGWERFKMI